SSIRLQNGCRVGIFPPIFQLGIHPEMLSPAILNRSMPRIPVSDMRSSLHPCISISQTQCTRGTSSSGGQCLRLSQLCVRIPIIGADLSEPSPNLPPWSTAPADGKLGQTSTNFRANVRNSAPMLGIEEGASGKTAPEADGCALFV